MKKRTPRRMRFEVGRQNDGKYYIVAYDRSGRYLLAFAGLYDRPKKALDVIEALSLEAKRAHVVIDTAKS